MHFIQFKTAVYTINLQLVSNIIEFKKIGLSKEIELGFFLTVEPWASILILEIIEAWVINFRLPWPLLRYVYIKCTYTIQEIGKQI